MATNTYTATGEITNECTCKQYDPETGEYTEEPASDCYGWCWEDAVEDFAEVTRELREDNETGWWKVTNLRLWDGEVSGYFHADTVTKLIEGMTVRSRWIMRYTVFPDNIEYSLSHHDAPMGSSTILRPVSEDDVDELGLC